MKKPINDREGKVLVLVGLLMISLIGIVAFAVDLGWILMTKTQLQSSSDSGSLAGATELISGLGASSWRTPAEVEAAAKTQAVAYVAEHIAGEATSTFIDPDRDVQLGKASLDPATGVWSFQWGVQPYNAVGVTTRRSDVGTNPGDRQLPLMFARVLGQDFANVTATSVAVIMPASEIRLPPGGSSGLSPFAFHQETWRKYWRARNRFETNFLTSAQINANDAHTTYIDTGVNADGSIDENAVDDPLFHQMVEQGNNLVPQVLFDDQYGVVNPELDTAGNVTNVGDGVLEMNIYPIDSTSGNFGTVDIGASGNSTDDLKRQIEFGISEQDMTDLGEVSITPPLSLEGDTGISAGIKAAIQAIIGQCRGILLYSTVTGPGNNAVYQIQEVVGIRMMYVNFSGSNKVLIVQPCNWSDAAGVPDYDAEIGEETTFFTRLILAD